MKVSELFEATKIDRHPTLHKKGIDVLKSHGIKRDDYESQVSAHQSWLSGPKGKDFSDEEQEKIAKKMGMKRYPHAKRTFTNAHSELTFGQPPSTNQDPDEDTKTGGHYVTFRTAKSQAGRYKDDTNESVVTEATRKKSDLLARLEKSRASNFRRAAAGPRPKSKLSDEDRRKVYDVMSAEGPDVDMWSPKFGRLVGQAKAAGVIDDKRKLFKWLEDKGMFGPVSDRLRAPGDKYYPTMKEGKDFPSDTVCKCGHRLGQHVSRFEAAKGGERRCTCGDCSCKAFRKDLKESTDAKRGPKVHDFTHIHEPHTSNAYDETQTNDDIKDGDVFHLGGDKTGVMVQAWPVEVTGNHNKESGFHTLGNGKTWDTLDDGKYKKSAELAHATAKKHGKKVSEGAVPGRGALLKQVKDYVETLLGTDELTLIRDGHAKYEQAWEATEGRGKKTKTFKSDGSEYYVSLHKSEDGAEVVRVDLNDTAGSSPADDTFFYMAK